MKKLYIAVNDYLLTQGINSVVDQFILNKEELLNNGIELMGVIDCSGIHKSIPNRGSVIASKIDYSKIKKIVHDTYIGNITAIYRGFILVAKRVANQIDKIVGDELKNEDTIILFQDPLAAFYAVKKNIAVNAFFMSHAYEDELEQLFINYPHIKASSFETKLRNIYRVVYETCRVIVICNKAKQWVLQHHSNTKIFVLYNTVPLNPICKMIGEHSPINIVMASSINIRKGFDMFIEALDLIGEDRLKDVCFHIFGDGPYLSIVEQHCKEKHYNVVCYGRTNNPYQKYAEMDAFLMTSRSETLPMGILEAMSCGLPIFSTNVGAIDELVIDDYNGKLFEADVHGVVQSIESILSNKDCLKKLGMCSRERFTNCFSNQKWVMNLSSIIND